MKPAIFRSATRTVGKMFFGLLLLVLAVAAGFGGTALIVYHQLGGSRPAEARVAQRARSERKEAVRPVTAVAGNDNTSQTRPVAAIPSDVPAYTYADNNNGQPSLPDKRQKPVANVPAALNTPTVEPATTDNLNDPESHYIVDSRTGRVIGIDGTAGAQREAAEEQRRLDAAPRAVAVQTPEPEVRVASAVTEAGQPVYHDAAPANTSVSPGSQYIPVRRAMPVTADVATEPNRFNVAEYLADDQNRPALRTQPVYPASTRVARAARTFRLPDGTQVSLSN